MKKKGENPNESAKAGWKSNAGFWDRNMGEGNDFVKELIWPAVDRMLRITPGERVLDIACGNGLFARRLSAMGALVTAFDFVEEMIEAAKARKGSSDERIEYRILDATDEAALLGLGIGSFDSALCSMGLMDMAETKPLFKALSRLLRTSGVFVFSVLHPCFNNPHSVHVAELREARGKIKTDYSIKVFGYMTSTVTPGIAIPGQPATHPEFHRPLSTLLEPGFEAGFVMDMLEERAFPPGFSTGSEALSWSGNYSEIPPVLVARMRLPAGSN